MRDLWGSPIGVSAGFGGGSLDLLFCPLKSIVYYPCKTTTRNVKRPCSKAVEDDAVSDTREICASLGKDIRKIPQQTATLNNQTFSDWRPEPLPIARNSQAASEFQIQS